MKKAKSPEKESKQNIKLNSSDKSVLIEALKIEDPDVFEFLKGKTEPTEWVRKAIRIGVLGLRTMGTGANLDYVENRFQVFMKHIENKFNDENKVLQERLDAAFDISKNTSMLSRFQAKLDELLSPEKSTSVTFKLMSALNNIADEQNKNSVISKLRTQLEEYLGDENGKVKQIIQQTFDPNNKQSAIHKLLEELDAYLGDDGKFAKKLDETFDLNDANTPMGQLSEQLTAYFDSKQGSLKQLLDNTFDPMNKRSVTCHFETLLEQNFDIEKGRIRKLLDPSRPESPLADLKKELLEHLQRIEKEIVKVEAQSEEREKGTAKGQDFESEMELYLERIARPFKDEIKNLSKITGIAGKKGDFLARIEGEIENQIVIEAKDSSAYSGSKKKVLDELDESMRNRSARFGIFVFKKEEQMPSEFKPAKILKDRIITSMEGYGLFFSYMIARDIVLTHQKRAQDKIPVDKIQQEVELLVQQARLLDSILSNANKISSSAQAIRDEAENIKSNMSNSLEQIKYFLSKNA